MFSVLISIYIFLRTCFLWAVCEGERIQGLSCNRMDIIINEQPALNSSALSFISLRNARDCSAGPLWHIKGMNVLRSFQLLFRSWTRLPHTHFLHYRASLLKVSHCCFWPSIDAFLMSWLFMGQILSLLSFHSDGSINTCTLHLWGSPANKQNGRKSRHGISLAGNTTVTRGGDVRRKCPRQTVVSDEPGCSSLGFPIASLLCLSKRLKLTSTHHLWASPRVPILNFKSCVINTSKVAAERNR